VNIDSLVRGERNSTSGTFAGLVAPEGATKAWKQVGINRYLLPEPKVNYSCEYGYE
jgi:hypothetical protein